jgi:hypothetical protein
MNELIDVYNDIIKSAQTGIKKSKELLFDIIYDYTQHSQILKLKDICYIDEPEDECDQYTSYIIQSMNEQKSYLGTCSDYDQNNMLYRSRNLDDISTEYIHNFLRYIPNKYDELYQTVDDPSREIFKKRIEEIEIPIPSIEIQMKIVGFCEKMVLLHEELNQ